MKILLVTPMPPQPQAPGAIPLVLHAQLTALRARHEVTVLTVAGGDPGEQEAVAALAASGIKVHAVPLLAQSALGRWQRRGRLASDWLSGRLPWRTAWFRSPGLQSTLDALLATEHFDWIQVEDNAMGVYRYRTTTPIIFTEHEARRPRSVDWRKLSGIEGRAALLQELDWQRWPAYQRRIWPRFDRIQVFSARDAATIADLAPTLSERVRVNPFSVAQPVAANPAHEEAKSLLFVGNYTHAPNVDAALWLAQEIMPTLRRRAPGVKLTLVGIYPPPAVQALAGADITVTGAVPEIEPWLERAAVVMAPLRIGGGMRMKVLQAMAMGKAVVTTPRGAEGLEQKGTPPLVVAENVEEIAAATAALLDAPAQRRELGCRARQFVATHYSPAAYVQRLEAIYAELQSEPQIQ
ncbi:MAG: glycosyltransferase family 4 protein [Caldilineaceae bacterium]